MSLDRIERRLPDILTELSAPQVPDYLDDILGRTARTPQRPGWASLERWLPMDLTLRPAIVGRMPWRSIGILVLLTLALVAALAYVGSQPRRVAPLFGPAANGSLIYERDGDVYAADADLTGERLLIGGDTLDIAMRWSLDGETIFFGRDEIIGVAVMAADAQGGNVRRLSDTLVPPVTESAEVSPDGRSLVVIDAVQNPRRLAILDLAGDAGLRYLEIPDVEPLWYARWRPPGNDEIVFLARSAEVAPEFRLYVVRADGSSLRLVAGGPEYAFQDPVLSDEGRTMIYWNWEPGVLPGRDANLHVLDLDSGQSVRTILDGTASTESRADFIDERHIIYERGSSDGTLELRVVDLDGNDAPRSVGPRFPSSSGGWMLAPDRRTVLYDPFDGTGGRAMLFSIATGEVRETALDLPDGVSWQRRAP